MLAEMALVEYDHNFHVPTDVVREQDVISFDRVPENAGFFRNVRDGMAKVDEVSTVDVNRIALLHLHRPIKGIGGAKPFEIRKTFGGAPKTYQ